MINYDNHPVRKMAVKTLLLPDGTRLDNQVLTLDTDGKVLSYRQLSGEEAFCEWYRGTWVFQ